MYVMKYLTESNIKEVGIVLNGCLKESSVYHGRAGTAAGTFRMAKP